MYKKTCFFLIISIILSGYTIAQKPHEATSSSIYQKVKKLNVLGSVLYMAAHPDDENTALIAYMANEKLYKTGYLSLTRGDGGQNLIGSNMREKLGLIRTQELLQARSIDGGIQFFSRANDFGFSKNPTEVFTKWDRNQLLADAVWVIRNFQPDVIITRFPKDSRAGHGQHSASSMLAEDAFAAAGDSTKFTEQLKYVKPWTVKRIVWNLSPWGFASESEFEKYADGYLKFDIGAFNVNRGKSIGEIAAESRSMHKSQAFGSAGFRGKMTEFFEPTKGFIAKKDLFEDINTTWHRLGKADSVAYFINTAIAEYKLSEPTAIVPILIKAYGALQKLSESNYKAQKSQELREVIWDCLGLYSEVLSNHKQATPSTSIIVSTEIINRSNIPVKLLSSKFVGANKDSSFLQVLPDNTTFRWSTPVTIDKDAEYSIPYWLKEPFSESMYKIARQQDVGKPVNDPAIEEVVTLSVLGQELSYTLPVQFKKVDPVRGEIYSPFVIVPPVFINLSAPAYMFPNGETQAVTIKLLSLNNPVKGQLSLALPSGWISIPEKIEVTMSPGNNEQSFTFSVTPKTGESFGAIEANFNDGTHIFNRGLDIIQYEHIPEITNMPIAKAKAESFPLAKKGISIGYLMGAGDNVPEALTQIGYSVSFLKDKDFDQRYLRKYDAVVIGVRAFNTIDKISYYEKILLDYVKAGGTVIAQYNVDKGLLSTNLGPYPINLSTKRITYEDAPVKVIDSQSPILNYPNKITPKDFDNWVQERGLYFPDNWDRQYKTVISSHDPNENALDGGILWAKYGKGHYIYSSYDWFRELPAGVPGAYRLFANMLSIGKK